MALPSREIGRTGGTSAMLARVLGLLLALAALGGCQLTPAANPPSGSASDSRITPKPGPATPHQTLRFRPVLMDPAIDMPLMASPTTNPTPVTDPAQAARIRQAPGLADDPGAQQTALASLDCAKPDPIKGKDDPVLPLATCDDSGMEFLLGPVLLDGSAVADASYFHDAEQDSWVLNLSFTPTGRQRWADYTGTHTGGFVAFVVDGRVISSPKINERIDGDTEITGAFTEQTARDLAAAINNH
jgi:hypothetical protein